MALKLETLETNSTLASLQVTIAELEALGYELVTLAGGVVNGTRSNTAAFRNRTPGDTPGPLTLIEVPAEQALAGLEAALNNGELGGKVLISCAAVLVEGNETNVAADKRHGTRHKVTKTHLHCMLFKIHFCVKGGRGGVTVDDAGVESLAVTLRERSQIFFRSNQSAPIPFR